MKPHRKNLHIEGENENYESRAKHGSVLLMDLAFLVCLKKRLCLEIREAFVEEEMRCCPFPRATGADMHYLLIGTKLWFFS